MIQPYFSTAVNTTVKSSPLEVLFSGSSQTKPAHRCGPQILDYYLMHMVISGTGTFEARGHTHRLQAGECFFIYPGELVTYESDEEKPWQYRWVAFNGMEAESLLEETGLTRELPIAKSEDAHEGIHLLTQIEHTLLEEGADLRLKVGGLIRLFFAHLASARHDLHAAVNSAQSSVEQQVEKAIRWLSLQYSQHVSIDQLAHSLGYHRTHLSKIFKQKTGLSPMQHLLKLRMDKAKVLLNSDLNVQQVAASVGFNDPLYFSKQFKKAFGVPPIEYQKQMKNKTIC